jgi:hypothetical protein
VEKELHAVWTPARDGEWSDLCLDSSPTLPSGAPVTICSRPGGFRNCSGYFGEERNPNYCLCRESNKIPQSSGLFSSHYTDGGILTLSVATAQLLVQWLCSLSNPCHCKIYYSTRQLCTIAFHSTAGVFKMFLSFWFLNSWLLLCVRSIRYYEIRESVARET